MEQFLGGLQILMQWQNFLILDFLALIGSIFLLVWTHVNYYPPFKTARNRYEEFLQEQKLAA